MKNSPKQSLLWLYGCVKRAIIDTLAHDGIEHAGYLAFLGLLAMFPFLVFIVAVIGVIGQGEGGARFLTDMLLTLPDNITEALKPRVLEIVSGPPQGLLTVSILGAIWTASSAVEGLRTILNRAYRVTTPPAYLLRRGLSVLQLLIFSGILITGMLIIILTPLILHNIEAWLGFQFLSQEDAAWGNIVFLVTYVMLLVAVSYIYYIIPNIKQHLFSVVPGALIVVVLWMAGAHIFTIYLSHFEQVSLIYGSLGGMIAALLFFYICNVIFIFGAEFNHQVAESIGLRVIEREKAVSE